MKPLILHPTDICQWHALVNEAQATTRHILDENTESYLVFLLMRFSQGPQLMESVLALDFLESMQRGTRHQAEKLKEIGDKSLLFCGLFPGIAEKRHVSLDYFIDLGQAAYLIAGELQEKHPTNLYIQLSSKFIELQQILQAMRAEFKAPLLLNQLWAKGSMCSN
ncbi:MAG: hypothetical protein LCH30_03745 [Proteobacteria bacterium]|nr:hypothetical protein [Pseudomonadota bacterium]